MRRFLPTTCLAFSIIFAPTASLAQKVEESVRVATFNAYLLSPVFKCAHENFADCLVQIVGETEDWAEKVADTILKDTDRFDIIAINEAWDADAKDILAQRLTENGDYPNYVKEVDADLISVRGPALQAILGGMPAGAAFAIYGLPDLEIRGEDSGLMLFVNDDFEVLPLPDTTFQWGDESGEELFGSTGEVAFRLYEACGGFDCLSAKGVALVRLRHKPSERNYTIVFTHMQADYFDKGELHHAERKKQFAQAQELIEQTLAPLSANDLRRERILMMGDLNVPVFHIPVPPPPVSEWDSLFNDPASFFTDTLYEAWARTTSPADPGYTNYFDKERLDYILASPEPYQRGGIEGPICVQHMTIPTDFHALESDHDMVHADLNIGFHHCHPQIAYKVVLETGSFDGKPQEQQFIDDENGEDITEIRFPGSMQWFHVSRDPGKFPDGSDAEAVSAYSIGTTDPNVPFDVYLPKDLTTPIARYYADERLMLVDEDWVFTHTFVLPREFYIRTRGRDRAYTGDYRLLVRRHTCATREEACPLQPGKPQSATLTKAGSLFGTQDEAWFEFDVIGGKQTVTITADGLLDPANFTATLEDFTNSNGSPPPPEQAVGTRRIFTDQMGAGSTGHLLIRRGTPTASEVEVWAKLDTSIRQMEAQALICEDETNPEFGSDEIFTQVTIDGTVTRFPAAGEVEFDCDNSREHRDWQAHFGFSPITFEQGVGVRVIEEDDSSPNDPSRFKPVPALPTGRTEFDGVLEPLQWTFEDGHYRLNYMLRMRQNAPVKSAPGATP